MLTDGPILSIIIPCYNQGIFLKETLDSLATIDRVRVETIIINDGSTDTYTNEYLRELSSQGYHVIFQENQGLGGARNRGIKQARGKYILPLDADNKIFSGYIDQGVAVMEHQEDVAVVYANAGYFGDKQGIQVPGSFNLQRLMLGNYIDACAVIRKAVIEDVGYYDNMKIMGLEDWDLWLRIALKGHKFYYIDETLFSYRVHHGSMLRSLNRDIRRMNEIEDYLAQKYRDQLSYTVVKDYFLGKIKRRPFRFLYRLVLQKYFPAYYERSIREGKMYKGWLYE